MSERKAIARNPITGQSDSRELPMTPTKHRRKEMSKENIMFERLTKEVFCERFVSHMLKIVPFKQFDDGETIESYAKATAPSYYDDYHASTDDLWSPEELAEEDFSLFGE